MSIILLLTLASVVYKSESIETRCCLPEQGDFVDDADGSNAACFNFDTKIQTNIRLNCTEPPSVFPAKFTAHANGSITLYPDGFNLVFENGTFCLEENQNNETEKKLVLCLEPSDSEHHIVGAPVLGYGQLVSVLFLALTAITYCIVPELRDVQGKCIINFCLSLAIGLLFLEIIKIGFEYGDVALCATQGFLMYFFVLGGLFWINAISIQMLISIRRPSKPDYSWRSFSWYALYAWGCPALLTISMAIDDFQPGKQQKPGIGLNKCWSYNQHREWYYMYRIMSILIISKIICIYIYLSIHLWRQTFSSTLTKEIRYKFLMILRMFIITGIPWIFEMISTSFEDHIIRVVFELLNMLQGPLIFLVLVVFRPRAIKGLHNLGLLSCISGLVEKHLAVADDAEEPMQQTIDVPVDNRI